MIIWIPYWTHVFVRVGDFVEVFQVPKVDSPVLGGWGEKEFVWMELNVENGPFVVDKLRHELASSQVPEPDSRVLARGGDPLPVRTELDTVDPIGMAFVCENATFAPDIPQLEALISWSWGQEVSVGMKVGTRQSGPCDRSTSWGVWQLQDPIF